MRLDLFVKDKLNISRQKAREIIEQGLVTIDNKIITKPSYNVNSDANISIGSTESILKYVGRGGYKLEKAIEFFNINFKIYGGREDDRKNNEISKKQQQKEGIYRLYASKRCKKGLCY